EWTWRRRARDQEEQIRRAKENRDLLVDRASQLRSHISGLISLGYKPRNSATTRLNCSTRSSRSRTRSWRSSAASAPSRNSEMMREGWAWRRDGYDEPGA